MTTKIIGISGSLRTGSYNTSLLDSVRRFMPDDIGFEVASIREIPLYNADEESESGVPESVAKVKEQLASAGGLIIATPEYNHSIPGVTKNAIDWLSRPPRDIPRVFGNLPVALMGATPGRGATLLSQNAWLPILHTLGMRLWSGRSMAVPAAGEKFGDEGLHDEKTLELLGKFVRGFTASLLTNPRRSRD